MALKPNKKDAVEIVRRLREAGHTAYWVGGCVRDKLMGVKPDDYDVATTALPNDVRKVFRRTVAVGESFGVMLVVMHRVPYEVATFRSDESYSDGRRPDKVTFVSPEEDVSRRDFTINGMFYDPIDERVIDYVGGKKDIEAKIIRTIGKPEDRFAEDKLRLMRAVRFAAQTGFEIEQNTRRVIIERASEISVVSAERIRDELVKILTGPRPKMGVELLSELGLLKPILPEVEAMKGVEQPPQFHPEGDVWVHTMIMLDNMQKNPPPEFAMGVLLHDVGKPPTYTEAERIRFDRHTSVGAEMAAAIMRGLRFSRREQDMVESLVLNHLKFMEVRNMRLSTLKRFMRLERFDLHMELHRLDCIGSHGDLDSHKFVLDRLDDFKTAEEAESIRPMPLITGNDLIKLGMQPGPVFKEILEAVEDAQLENIVTTPDEAIKFAQDFIKKREGK